MASNITTLVEKAKQGDADAFSTLYQMYYPKTLVSTKNDKQSL